VVEPGAGKRIVADEEEKHHDLVGRPTDDETTADDHWRHGGVVRSFGCGGTFYVRYLKSEDQGLQCFSLIKP